MWYRLFEFTYSQQWPIQQLNKENGQLYFEGDSVSVWFRQLTLLQDIDVSFGKSMTDMEFLNYKMSWGAALFRKNIDSQFHLK